MRYAAFEVAAEEAKGQSTEVRAALVRRAEKLIGEEDIVPKNIDEVFKDDVGLAGHARRMATSDAAKREALELRFGEAIVKASFVVKSAGELNDRVRDAAYSGVRIEMQRNDGTWEDVGSAFTLRASVPVHSGNSA